MRSGAVIPIRLRVLARTICVAWTCEEVAHFYDGASGFKNKSKVAVTSRDPLAAIADTEGEIPQTEMPVGGCAAGIFGVTIAADGSITPCRRMDLPVENIKDGYALNLYLLLSHRY